MIRHILWPLATALLLLGPGLQAQNQVVVQVVTKTIEKTFAYQDGYEVNVEGEKAEIFVETSPRREVRVRMELSAKHPNLATAEADLQSIQFVTERLKNKIYLRNYRYGEAGAAQSMLNVKYYITLPESCPVYVKNYFGAASISNLSNRLRIFGEYSQIDIDNVKGLIDIRTRFGDIIGEKMDGTVTINARRSDITLMDIAGSYNINAQYGTLKLAPTAGLLDMNVHAEKSEVHFYGDRLPDLAYTLSTTHGRLRTPPSLRTVVLENTPEVQRVQVRPNREYTASVTISVAFGDLFLEDARARIREGF